MRNCDAWGTRLAHPEEQEGFLRLTPPFGMTGGNRGRCRPSGALSLG